MHCSHDWSCTDHVTDHALITWLSCTDHVAEHALFTWLITHLSRDISCNDHVARMHWSRGWSCTDHVNSPIPVHFSSLIPKLSMFTLAISCLTTSNLPWFVDLTFQDPMQYCSLQHWTLLPSLVISTTGYCFCFGSVSVFFLELFFHSSPVTYWALPTWRVHRSVSKLFAFSYCSWGSQGKNTEVVCQSLLQWTTFCQNSPPWPVCLGWCYMAWLVVSLSSTRLWSMWLDGLVFSMVSVRLPSDGKW